MTERRYRDDEVREIFGLAANEEAADRPRRSDPDGLTLADLQDIGREVGLEPTRIAQAAATLDVRRAVLPRRTSWGMPVAVGRIVELPRAPTEHEWEQLVAELRMTFRARGRVTSHGSLREWSNGNLHACVEPAGGGYRLRLGTLKGDAMPLNAAGVAGVGFGAMFFGVLLMAGELTDGAFVPMMFGAAGVGALVSNWLRLPRWADTRERQMEYIADRVRALLESEPKGRGAEG